MLLRFIVEDPKNRYSFLEPFINLREFQRIESALRTERDACERKCTAVNAEVTRLGNELRQVFQIALEGDLTTESLLAELNRALAIANIAPIGDLASIAEVAETLAAEIGGADQSRHLAELGSLRSDAQRLGFAHELFPLAQEFQIALREHQTRLRNHRGPVLTDLLVSGRRAISQYLLADCPVCEQNIDTDVTVGRLDERIELDREISDARDGLNVVTNNLHESVEQIARRYQNFVEDWRERIVEPLPNAYSETRDILTAFSQFLHAEDRRENEADDIVAQLAGCVRDHNPMVDIIDRIISELGGGERRGQLLVVLDMCNAASNTYPCYQKACARQERATQARDATATIYAHGVTARKAALSEALSEVADAANEMYERIHPGEGIATSSLQVRDVGEGSVNLLTRFHGAEEHPLLHYSESHLDTLGLCYFFAFRKREAEIEGSFRVLVLDDVLHSVDAEHRSRIARLIRDEFSDHQLIITTHDIHFFEALRRELGGGHYQYLRINKWDMERGPYVGDPLTDIDRVTNRESREAMSQENLAAATGRFFEWLLQNSAEAAQISVPMRMKLGYDIGVLWPPVLARLRKQAGFMNTHQRVLDTLEQNRWVRNVCGAHYNEEAVAPTPNEVIEFAEGVADLYAALYCDDCGDFVRRNHDQSWECAGRHLRYNRSAESSK